MKDIDWFAALKALTIRRADRNGCVSMTTKLIATRMGCHPVTAKRHLSALEKSHLIRSEKIKLTGCIEQTHWTWRARKPKSVIELSHQIEFDIE